ncbi:hypothetical protein BJF92_02355 [Rhizobium rhizosphaerae]|uniref:Secreted protein n=1 Tax=Xaviernesmea rhizosphaerae TaxID=1672749 RepID=A0A1Q9AKX8_9HYPH|nr:hypothetical protein [Xaviernesmea rhizosphaerae]OLP55969.1 hypothetical protein BJF92_02355 [Xaviernesmea rhizosphaerae]
MAINLLKTCAQMSVVLSIAFGAALATPANAGADGGLGPVDGIPGCGGGTDPSPDGNFYVPGSLQKCNPGKADRQKLASVEFLEHCLKRTGSDFGTADLLQRLDDFRETLRGDERAELDHALQRSSDGGIAQCGDADESMASCENGAYLGALTITGLLPRFVSGICPQR